MLFQNLALEASLMRAVQSIQTDPHEARVVDVGCGEGPSLLAFSSTRICSWKSLQVLLARRPHTSSNRKSPGMNFQCGDATKLEYPGESFELDLEFPVAADRLRGR